MKSDEDTLSLLSVCVGVFDSSGMKQRYQGGCWSAAASTLTIIRTGKEDSDLTTELTVQQNFTAVELNFGEEQAAGCFSPPSETQAHLILAAV